VNMITSSDAANFPNSASFFVDHGNGTRGFTDPRACVTQAGYGYSSRQASPCPQGTFNDKDTRGTCTACPYGTSTAGAGAGTTAADCKLAPGFGSYNGGRMPCPIGEIFYSTSGPRLGANVFVEQAGGCLLQILPARFRSLASSLRILLPTSLEHSSLDCLLNPMPCFLMLPPFVCRYLQRCPAQRHHKPMLTVPRRHHHPRAGRGQHCKL
jgi:hypothetical protein